MSRKDSPWFYIDEVVAIAGDVFVSQLAANRMKNRLLTPHEFDDRHCNAYVIHEALP